MPGSSGSYGLHKTGTETWIYTGSSFYLQHFSSTVKNDKTKQQEFEPETIICILGDMEAIWKLISYSQLFSLIYL